MDFIQPLANGDAQNRYRDRQTDPATVAGSVVPATFFNTIQDELLDVIETLGGLTPAAGDLTQLRQAIEAYVASRLAALAAGGQVGLTTQVSASHGGAAVDIAAGQRLTAAGRLLVLGSTLTKRLDLGWAAGTEQGGLDTGAPAVSTWYYLHLIGGDGPSTDAVFSASAAAPALPAGYSWSVRLTAVYRRGDGTIRPYIDDGRGGIMWQTVGIDVTQVLAGSPTPSPILITAPVPPGYPVTAIANVAVETAIDHDSPLLHVLTPGAGNRATLSIDVGQATGAPTTVSAQITQRAVGGQFGLLNGADGVQRTAYIGIIGWQEPRG